MEGGLVSPSSGKTYFVGPIDRAGSHLLTCNIYLTAGCDSIFVIMLSLAYFQEKFSMQNLIKI